MECIGLPNRIYRLPSWKGSANAVPAAADAVGTAPIHEPCTKRYDLNYLNELSISASAALMIENLMSSANTAPSNRSPCLHWPLSIAAPFQRPFSSTLAAPIQHRYFSAHSAALFQRQISSALAAPFQRSFSSTVSAP
jgi:hypothetical protein